MGIGNATMMPPRWTDKRWDGEESRKKRKQEQKRKTKQALPVM